MSSILPSNSNKVPSSVSTSRGAEVIPAPAIDQLPKNADIKEFSKLPINNSSDSKEVSEETIYSAINTILVTNLLITNTHNEQPLENAKSTHNMGSAVSDKAVSDKKEQQNNENTPTNDAGSERDIPNTKLQRE